MKPYLSIIVPVYKVEKYLQKCIESILSQTFTHFELILIDDGSPDACPAICDEYASKDKRIKVIHKENGGLVSARKAGLDAAIGEYVGFVDSDDWIEMKMYEELCSKAMQFNSDIIICDCFYNYENNEIKSKQDLKPGFYNKVSLMNEVYPKMIFTGEYYNFLLLPVLWNKIFKRNLLKNNLYNIDNSIRLGEDVACTISCLLDAESIYMLDSVHLYHYRINATSMTQTYDPNMLNRILILYEMLKNMNIHKNVFDISTQLNYYITYFVIIAIENEFSKKNKRSCIEKRNLIKFIVNNTDIMRALNSISIESFPLKIKLYISILQTKNIILFNVFISIFKILKK